MVEQSIPEEPTALKLAMEYGKKYDADILLATDPDTDRVGGGLSIIDWKPNRCLAITQKQKKGELADSATVLKTIVTSELGRDIAETHGLKTIDTLTGFKYSEKIKAFKGTGTANSYSAMKKAMAT